MTPLQAIKLSDREARQMRLSNGEYAVTMRLGKWYAVSPVSRLTLGAPWDTPQQALASVIRHGWKVS